MGSKAVHQFIQTTTEEPTDILPAVRYTGGEPENISIERAAIGSQIRVSDPIPILSADVLVMNGTPQLIVFGTLGKIIIPLQVIVTMTGGTINYATNTTLTIGSATTINDTTYTLTGTLPLVAAPTTVLLPVVSASSTIITSVVSGEALYVRVKTGNPTAGDGDLVVTTSYMLIDG